MRGAGIVMSDLDLSQVRLVDNCFWKIDGDSVVSAFPEVKSNPLDYRCAPNAATPDYVCSGSIEDFIAYGFKDCYGNLCPDYFTMWNMVGYEDVKWFREYFLRILEKLVVAVYNKEVTPESSDSDFDHGEWAEHLNIGNGDRDPEDGEPDEEELMYTVCPGPADENGFSVGINWSMMYGEGGFDSDVLWLSWDAILERNPVEVKAAIEESRKVNNLGGACSPLNAWQEVIANWKEPAEVE